jgi:hypothetical protein
MKVNEIEVFFQNIGEIWRDITALEFLMRCAIMYKDWDETKFPKPPYDKWKAYKIYPKSFESLGFEIIVTKFNKRYPNITIPTELIELRNAMAHWLITQINEWDTNQLIKFREDKDNKELVIEFSISLDLEKINAIKVELCNLRRIISAEITKNVTQDINT